MIDEPDLPPRQAALQEMADCFRARLTKASIVAWLKNLEDFSEAVVLDALARCVREFERFPSIKQVRDLCGAGVADDRATQHRANKTYRRDEDVDPPTVADKRRLLQRVADGQRAGDWNRYPTLGERQASLELLGCSDEHLETMSMAEVVIATIPRWKNIGRMPKGGDR